MNSNFLNTTPVSPPQARRGKEFSPPFRGGEARGQYDPSAEGVLKSNRYYYETNL